MKSTTKAEENGVALKTDRMTLETAAKWLLEPGWNRDAREGNRETGPVPSLKFKLCGNSVASGWIMRPWYLCGCQVQDRQVLPGFLCASYIPAHTD